MNVTFRKFSDGEIIAIFPDVVADTAGGILSYMHVGQHGSASPEIAQELEPATSKEYKPLLSELKSIGYLVEIT